MITSYLGISSTSRVYFRTLGPRSSPLGLGRLGCDRKRSRRIQPSRVDFGLEPRGLVAAVTEGLVLRVPAPAQADGGAARQIKRLAVLIVNRELTFDAQRPVIPYSDLRFSQGVLL